MSMFVGEGAPSSALDRVASSSRGGSAALSGEQNCDGLCTLV